ncbi:hypothetical protein VTL71DRAFT_3613 [Oculimacula yallundae]|uniref:Uncharacterized protein n=1 Tax=Oculimacula yallundae TaxID=86028 RepID=A0ABR4C7N4_9HELO
MFPDKPDAICEPAGAAKHLSCSSCLDFQICSPSCDFLTTYASLVEMFSNDCTLVDGTPKPLRRETTNSLKRSVRGMKSLMTLKLLSPTLPQSEPWPSSCQGRRSTFGSISPSQQISKVPGKANNPLGLRLSVLPPSHRDTPIYNEPGSPLPGRAYYTSDDLCFCSSPSDCNEGCVFHDLDQGKRSQARKEFVDEDNSHFATNDPISLRRLSGVSGEPRSSGLSFQCSGENPSPSEAAWIGSSLPINHKSQLTRHRSTSSLPIQRNVESWLSDTTSEIDQDVLACATTISPTRAHMIIVNSSRLSKESLPPRKSSLEALSSATYPDNARYSWASSDDSPPSTPTGEREFDDNRAPCPEPQWVFPTRRHDLAMNSPPMSPKVFPDPPADPRFSFSVMSAGIEVDQGQNVASRWSFDSTTSEHKSNVDLMTDLEDFISGFPTNMLLPDTPCISEIRLNFKAATQQHATPTTPRFPDESQNWFPRNSNSVANFSRPRRAAYMTSSQSTPMVQTTAWRSSYISSSTIQPHLSIPSPDLEPLSRIFPDSSDYTRLSLYAHIIAYIFITSLPTTSQPQESSHRRRRDTPYWTTYPLPSKAAAVLDHPRNSNSYTYSSESGLQTRVLALQSNLRKCIFRLMNNMDSSICLPRGEDLESGPAEVMLRAVEEVVRVSEMSGSTV